MNLRLRLALSYMLVVGLFLLTLTICHGILTVPAFNHLRDEAAANLKAQWTERLDQAYIRGGWEEVARAAERLDLPPFAEVILQVPGQPDRRIQLKPRHFRPGGPDGPMPGGPPHDGPQMRILEPGDQEIQVGDGGKLLIHMRPPPRTRNGPDLFMRALVLSALAGALVAFGAGMWLSSSISGPVKKLASATRDLGELELHRRVEVTGQGELAALGHSFNEMATRLEETVRHLSEEKRRVEKLEQNQRVFLSEVSHNLRTPLSAVLGWTEALQEGMGQGDELEKIHREVLYVSQTLQRLVDLSRWESSEPHLQRLRFDLREQVWLVVDTLAPAAESRQVQLDMVGLDEPVQVLGDPTRLRELVQILLENAVYHAGAGTVIKLTLARTGERVTLAVEDDGAGFDPAVTRGLGLPIAKRLARAHGDDLQLQSAPGKGTRASFTVEAA